jgi:hypothetical protein
MSFTYGWVLFVLGTVAISGCIFAITVRGEAEHGDAAGDHGHDAGGHGHASH